MLRGMMSLDLMFKWRHPITGHLAFAAYAGRSADANATHAGRKAGIDAITELRWITIATQPGYTPL